MGFHEAGAEILEVPEVDWAEGLTYATGSKKLKHWRTRTWETTLKFVKETQVKKGIDLFVGYLYPNQVEVSAVLEMRRLGIKCVNFFCDNIREFKTVPTEYSPFDLHWVPEYEALEMYHRAGLPHIHAPMPCWLPKKYRSIAKHENPSVVFIGSSDLLRKDLLGNAIEMGGKILVYGRGWKTRYNMGLNKKSADTKNFVRNQWLYLKKHGVAGLSSKLFNKLWPLEEKKINTASLGPEISSEDYIRITRESSIILGVNRVQSPFRPLRYPLKYSRLRDIEAPMLGACYLTEWTYGLSLLYKNGEEIETYKTAEEMLDKTRELLKNPGKRKNLRFKGQQRALRDHCISKTIRKIITFLSIK